MFCLVITY